MVWWLLGKRSVLFLSGGSADPNFPPRILINVFKSNKCHHGQIVIMFESHMDGHSFIIPHCVNVVVDPFAELSLGFPYIKPSIPLNK